jgi:hypothetical protein
MPSFDLATRIFFWRRVHRAFKKTKILFLRVLCGEFLRFYAFSSFFIKLLTLPPISIKNENTCPLRAFYAK